MEPKSEVGGRMLNANEYNFVAVVGYFYPKRSKKLHITV